jgi:AraC-like DNA-binding protein
MDRRVVATLTLLSNDWRNDHRVSDLAAAVNLAPSRLQHLFKDEVHMSIRKHILHRRLVEAARLIATTHDRISEIVYYVGFRDVPNFNHAFRRTFGVSPRQYRHSSALPSLAAAGLTKP